MVSPDLPMTNNLQLHHVLTLAHLLSIGAKHNHVKITTTALGRIIERSQQAASQHLTDLESGGFIERIVSGRSISVRVTKSGLSEVERFSAVLQHSLELASSPALVNTRLTGIPVSGMGEGAYYMALDGYTRQFESKIGYVPFPGTLNLQLTRHTDREAVDRLRDARTGIIIDGFSDGSRTYGWVKCFPALLHVLGATDTTDSSAGDGIRCELIILERTHHNDSIIEIISKRSLREMAAITDETEVIVEILSDHD